MIDKIKQIKYNRLPPYMKYIINCYSNMEKYITHKNSNIVYYKFDEMFLFVYNKNRNIIYYDRYVPFNLIYNYNIKKVDAESYTESYILNIIEHNDDTVLLKISSMLSTNMNKRKDLIKI